MRTLSVAILTVFLIVSCKTANIQSAPDSTTILQNLLSGATPLQNGVCDNGNTSILVFHGLNKSQQYYTVYRIVPSTFNYFYVVYAEDREHDRGFVVENKTTEIHEIDSDTFFSRISKEAPQYGKFIRGIVMSDCRFSEGYLSK